MISSKRAYLRDGPSKAFMPESYFTKDGENVCGKWLDNPFAQCVEYGTMELIYNGETLYIPKVDDVMFKNIDLFYI